MIPSAYEKFDLSKLLAVRQRKIGALLRQERNNASISIRNLSQETSISSGRIKAYELGERPIPLPDGKFCSKPRMDASKRSSTVAVPSVNG
ncbi:MAG: hypothetical protein U0V48_10330 [Anaerolineales bacterium]